MKIIELRQFAEQILFEPSLQSKLLEVDAFSDFAPGRAIQTPHLPARDANIALKNSEKSRSFPSFHHLETDLLARGHCLHFFANHELLALELMALMLLRFPDAEPEFRMGLAYTMKEEQEHLKGYLRCMEKMGVGFGEIQLNDQFWKLFSGVKSPLEFAAGMALVFEQCNVDFSRQYRDFFRLLDDQDTGDLLNKVYLEEIGHVKHGLKWVQKWSPGLSQWDAFVKSIQAPLGPHKAKGVIFDEEARRMAGFDEEYIQNLKLYNQSHGRTPHVYRFNAPPENELDLGLNDSIPNKTMSLRKDLELLQMHLAASDDLIWLYQKQRPEFLLELQNRSWTVPELRVNTSEFSGRKLGEMRPWGWSPRVRHEYSVLWDMATAPFKKFAQNDWLDSKKELYSKAFSQQFGREFSNQYPHESLSDLNDYGVRINTLDEFKSHLKANSQVQNWLIKAEYSSAGQSQFRFAKEDPSELQKAEIFMERHTQNHQSVVLEPLFEKVEDLSFLFWIEADKVKLMGITRFFTTPTGRYLGTQVGRFDAGMSESMLKFLRQKKRGQGRDLILQTAENLRQFLDAEGISKTHLGPIGIDALVYKNPNSHEEFEFKLKPIVEINPRYTMGFVALGLKKYVSTASFGKFRLVNSIEVKNAGGFEKWAQIYCASEKNTWNESVLIEGQVALTDPKLAQSFLAVLDVMPLKKEKGLKV
jgi:uncharacterized ferritin-like protein (DUF455 family)